MPATRSREPSPVRDANGNVVDVNNDRYGDSLKNKKVKIDDNKTPSLASQLKNNGPSKAIVLASSANDVVDKLDTILKSNIGILDRMKMASIDIGNLTFMREADHILCDDMNNTFLNTLGAWPDGCYALRGNALVFKGQIDGGMMYGGGYRKTLLSEQLDVFLNSDKN